MLGTTVVHCSILLPPRRRDVVGRSSGRKETFKDVSPSQSRPRYGGHDGLPLPTGRGMTVLGKSCWWLGN